MQRRKPIHGEDRHVTIPRNLANMRAVGNAPDPQHVSTEDEQQAGSAKRNTDIDAQYVITNSGRRVFAEIGNNPWTKRELLELLAARRCWPRGPRESIATTLHDQMTRVRKTCSMPEKPKRTGREVSCKLRELGNDGLDSEEFEDKIVEVAHLKAQTQTAKVRGSSELPEDAYQPGKRKREPPKVKKRSAVAGRPKKGPRQAPEECYLARAIVGETRYRYKIRWEDDESTGRTFHDSWELHEYVAQDLIDEWQERQANTERVLAWLETI